MCCSIFFFPLTHVGSITCCKFFVTVLIEGSEINYSVVTKKRKINEIIRKEQIQNFILNKRKNIQTGNYVTPTHKEEE